MKERLFRFKQFNVSHGRSAIPIGVDGVLVGAWADCRGDRLLDVGTGCGVIALMLAQRNPTAMVDAIDVHRPSVEEAEENFRNSPWSGRLAVKEIPFSALSSSGEKYDRIVSNPPFFNSGVDSCESDRMKARHQGELSPYSLLEAGSGILTEDGRIAMIVPSEMADALTDFAAGKGMTLLRECYVKDHEGSPEKRVLLEFGNQPHTETGVTEHLTMFLSSGEPTDRYRRLCGQFYLKF